MVFPVATCIVLTVMALNFVGDALRDSFDARSSPACSAE
jgi:ABC-type dipeptide/oligopeptide/nickel transport system permease subunit